MHLVKTCLSVLHQYTVHLFPLSPSLLFPHQAQRADELTIRTDEELEVMEWDDGDGWSKGRNQSGQEGYFPQTYVRAVSPSSSPRTSVQHIHQLMNSHLDSSAGPLQQLASQSLNEVSISNGPAVSNGLPNLSPPTTSNGKSIIIHTYNHMFYCPW